MTIDVQKTTSAKRDVNLTQQADAAGEADR